MTTVPDFQLSSCKNTAIAYILDIYHMEDTIYIWLLDRNGNPFVVLDKFHPEIFIHGDGHNKDKFIQKLKRSKILQKNPVARQKRHFYRNEDILVTSLRFKESSFLRKLHKKLYIFIDQFEIYHSDLEISTYYMLEKNIAPLDLVEINWTSLPPLPTGTFPFTHPYQNILNKRLLTINAVTKMHNYEYSLPKFKIMSFQLHKNHRLGLSKENPLLIGTPEHTKIILSLNNEKIFLKKLNDILLRYDPDVILTSFGDQKILPALFTLSQKHRYPLFLDRDPIHTSRKIITKGTSFNTYGNIVFRAASYPLFGRWHIDRSNSFVYKESELFGIIDLARISRLSVQKMARASTGTALTHIEIDIALKNNYLVPWQKSSVERAKTAYELLQIDKGGLVFEPDIRLGFVYEKVFQIDFAQMYPTIMVKHNISPETVLCKCCENDPLAKKVPETGYHICRKRTGIVSEALSSVLERRKYYKAIKNHSARSEEERAIADAKQKALKWLLVTSFGYLGYRNAKFGRLESHESVTALGREKLLLAKEAAEKYGYYFINAITDSMFLQRKFHSYAEALRETERLCQIIYAKAGIEITIESYYSWLVFVPSRTNAKLPASNRYFGRLHNGQLKVRGIMTRRKDIPPFIRQAQQSLLSLMQTKESVEELKTLHDDMYAKYSEFDRQIREKNIPWQELLFRKTVGKEFNEYAVENSTKISLRQLEQQNIHIQRGEKVKYLILSKRHYNKEKRYLVEEKLSEYEQKILHNYDVESYRNLLWDAFEEIWEGFAPKNFFMKKKEQQGQLF